MDLRPIPYGRSAQSLPEVLDEELASGQPACGVPHHTDPGITCMRKDTHLVDGVRALDLHAAKRQWHEADGGETWATWPERPPTPTSHP